MSNENDQNQSANPDRPTEPVPPQPQPVPPQQQPEAPLQHDGPPQHEAPPQVAAPPHYEAPPQHEAPPHYEAPPRYEAPPQVDQREWVAVPPPHPYAQHPGAGGGQRAQPKSGKALAIIAMALGLIALLTVLVSAFYFSPTIAYSGAAIGAIAIIVGIIALVKRSSPFGASITGTATGVLSLITVAVLAIVGSLAQTAPFTDAPQTEPESGATGEEWAPDTEQEALVQWPANMATGGIIFMGPGDPRPVPSDPIQPGTAPATKTVDRENQNDLLVYVDYSCPHCAMFEQANGEFLTQVLTNDVATVEVVPLSFMDRASTNDYSSRAASAVACLANSQPEAAWTGHTVLLNPELQPNGGDGLTNDEIIDLFDHATGGLNAEATDCIQTEHFTVFAKALNDWVFQNPVPNALEAEGRIQGTPSVFVNGAYYSGSADDAAAFEAFFEEHTN